MKVLIAEDGRVSRKLLETTLSKWGYVVVSTCDGMEAWDALRVEDPPRLVVLDWMMPGLSGIELCKKIKGRDTGSYIYIILLTSRSEKEDIVTGLDSGADDFVSKPFDLNELRSRLDVGARILEYEAALDEKSKQLSRYASQMETLAEERAKQLVNAERMATIGIMAAGIVHEINNPLTFISSNIQILKSVWADLERAVKESVEKATGNTKKLKFIQKELPHILEGAMVGVKRISIIVQGLRVYVRHDKGERNFCSINNCLEQALVICNHALKHHVTVKKYFDEGLPKIKANELQLEQVFINLFVNAADAIQTRGEGVLKIIVTRKEQFISIIIEDNGPGIPQEKMKSIWDPFYTTKEVGKGTGLGLAISQQIIKDHNGNIQAENVPGNGARFIVELPC